MKSALVFWAAVAVLGSAVSASAAIPGRKLAAIEPPRMASDASPSVEGHSSPASPDPAVRQKLDQLEATVKRLEETMHREARLRDNWIQARFEETDRKIIEVIGRLQLFVGWLIVLLLVIFVWLVELTRVNADKSPKKTKPAKPANVAIGGAPRSGRFG